MALTLNANAPVFIPTPTTCYYYAPSVPYDIRLQASTSLQPSLYFLPSHMAPFETASQRLIVPRPDLYYSYCYYYYCSPDQAAAAYAACSDHEHESYVSYEIPPVSLECPFPRRKVTLTPLPDDAAKVEGMQEMPLSTITTPVLHQRAMNKGDRVLKSSFRGFGELGSGNSIRGRRRSCVSVKKGRSAGEPVVHNSSNSTAQFEFKIWENCAAAAEISNGKTTVMIKNLPNKFNKKKLLGILDKHCLKENKNVIRKLKACNNEKLPSDAAVEENHGDGALSEFDFLYLPIDFKTKSNMGYAFVNFTTPTAAWRLYNFLHNYAWSSHGSHKVCEVTYARIQGLEALTKHFSSSIFVCGSDDFLPVRFVPPRDGRYRTYPELIGKRRLPQTYMAM